MISTTSSTPAAATRTIPAMTERSGRRHTSAARPSETIAKTPTGTGDSAERDPRGVSHVIACAAENRTAPSTRTVSTPESR
jgi:hypothetical protein